MFGGHVRIPTGRLPLEGGKEKYRLVICVSSQSGHTVSPVIVTAQYVARVISTQSVIKKLVERSIQTTNIDFATLPGYFDTFDPYHIDPVDPEHDGLGAASG